MKTGDPTVTFRRQGPLVHYIPLSGPIALSSSIGMEQEASEKTRDSRASHRAASRTVPSLSCPSARDTKRALLQAPNLELIVTPVTHSGHDQPFKSFFDSYLRPDSRHTRERGGGESERERE